MSPQLQARLDTAIALHGRFTGIVSHFQSGLLLLLRLTWGWQLAAAGYGHLTHIDNTVEAFRGWGVPLPVFSVYVSGATELIGGALLMLGLAARLISVPLIFNFLVAYATASRKTLVQLFAGPDRLDAYDAFINDSAFTLLVLALITLMFGPGKASLDHLIRQTILRRRSANAAPRGSQLPTQSSPSPSPSLA